MNLAQPINIKVF